MTPPAAAAPAAPSTTVEPTAPQTDTLRISGELAGRLLRSSRWQQ